MLKGKNTSFNKSKKMVANSYVIRKAGSGLLGRIKSGNNSGIKTFKKK